VLGHNRYDYFNPNRELLWIRFPRLWEEVRNEHKTMAGLPWCLFESFETLGLDQLYMYRCPSKHANPEAQMGMKREFLN